MAELVAAISTHSRKKRNPFAFVKFRDLPAGGISERKPWLAQGFLVIVGPLFHHLAAVRFAIFKHLEHVPVPQKFFAQLGQNAPGIVHVADKRMDETMERPVMRLVDEPADLAFEIGNLLLERSIKP